MGRFAETKWKRTRETGVDDACSETSANHRRATKYPPILRGLNVAYMFCRRPTREEKPCAELLAPSSDSANVSSTSLGLATGSHR